MESKIRVHEDAAGPYHRLRATTDAHVSDDSRLNQLGYKQELSRNLSLSLHCNKKGGFQQKVKRSSSKVSLTFRKIDITIARQYLRLDSFVAVHTILHRPSEFSGPFHLGVAEEPGAEEDEQQLAGSVSEEDVYVLADESSRFVPV